VSGLETRRLHALSREKTLHGVAMHTQDAPDANSVEPAVVNQTPDRLGMDPELICDVANADETVRLRVRS
jgi:hypothetical protein